MTKIQKFKTVILVIAFVFILEFCVFLVDTKSEIEPNASYDKGMVTSLNGLNLIISCIDKAFELDKIQHGSFWIIRNYIRADHGELSCRESITYTTHGDFTFVENLAVLLTRWNAPVSFALFAPGYDFKKTLESIQYARNCLPESELIQYYVTFHIYFPKDNMPTSIPLSETEALKWPYNCSLPPPYENVNRSSMYRKSHDLVYPINVGRNIARKAALTHFIFASDIELYPNLGFVDQFLEMIARNSSLLSGNRPRVFVLAAFEIDKREEIPETKTELQTLLKNKAAIPFHKRVCSNCHNIPNLTEWIAAEETDEMDIFTVGERRSKQTYWEPFYVSDNQEPFFDERVTWEGQKNKRIQGYAMCLLNYEFHVLNNAFLIHSPGIKVFKKDLVREKFVASMNKLIKDEIIPQYKILYGKRSGCIP